MSRAEWTLTKWLVVWLLIVPHMPYKDRFRTKKQCEQFAQKLVAIMPMPYMCVQEEKAK